MRLLILIPLLAVSACTSYQYFTLNSSLPEDNHEAFTFENDTLSFTYIFSGDGGPVQIEISNKLNVPLIIDWKKSSIIINGYSVSYWKDEATLDATNYSVSISGVITRPTGENFIPPHSSLSSQWDQVIQRPLNLDADTPFDRISYEGNAVKQYIFSAENSPLTFRSYLTFRLNESSEHFHYDHNFWVAEINQSTAGPYSPLSPHKTFYTSEATGAGTVLGVLALGGIIWVAVELAPEEE